MHRHGAILLGAHHLDKVNPIDSLLALHPDLDVECVLQYLKLIEFVGQLCYFLRLKGHPLHLVSGLGKFLHGIVQVKL